MISLSPLIADPFGLLAFREDPASALDGIARRVRRTATLDGGAALYDGGFSDADRTLSLVWKPTLAQAEIAKRLVQLYSLIRISFRDGVFLAAPESLIKDASGVYTLSLLVISKESA